MLQQINDRFNSACETCADKSCAIKTLREYELQLWRNNYHEVKFRKGDMIMSEGISVNQIAYLRRGLVKEYGTIDHFQQYILQVIKPHSYLGLESIFDNCINKYSYVALSDVTVCFLKLPVFLELIKENGQFSYEILSSICNNNLRNYHRFIIQHQKNSRGKLADVLLYFSNVIFESLCFILPLTRKEIAYMVGISRESVSKQLCGFEMDQIVKIRRREITILDVNKLEQISRLG
ncbi:Crp/Fnr family transcriptional regulator [Labilibaculum sp.]|uniref:Crp/Fnr family transcriptional regulator n=1 Tax=Labilibaculum sp. TaxID=2060723 RepID=UPI003565F76E